MRALVEVKTVRMKVSVREMFDTADVLMRLSEDVADLLLFAADATEQDKDDARKAGEGMKRAMMIGAVACRMTARALKEQEEAEVGGNAPAN